MIDLKEEINGLLKYPNDQVQMENSDILTLCTALREACKALDSIALPITTPIKKLTIKKLLGTTNNDTTIAKQALKKIHKKVKL